ncbi:MAG: ATP-binding cassette domain-containing protein [Bacteroidetes bacterium]|nr:ATP-binding cassette domain-containing protein [Bacteroidota bacterium]
MPETDKMLLEVVRLTIRRGDRNILDDISFQLNRGEHLAITGPSGSGKTLLGLALAQQVFYRGEITYTKGLQQSIAWVEQQHHFKNRSNTTDLYYQQRFNSFDAEDTLTVSEILPGDAESVASLLDKMKISYLADKPLIQLSNGENKKVQLATALLKYPSVLIMDQPFTGLDKETRIYLHHLVNELAMDGILIILITDANEIPECITHVASLEEGRLAGFESTDVFREKVSPFILSAPVTGLTEQKWNSVSHSTQQDFSTAIKMENVTVKYGTKTILNAINWEVKKGECWLLSGPNGAGKSTLLSLVTADNPQAYANSIYLFDKKRGSGESIWDIKKKIGFLSPELHVFFDSSYTCFETVASGLFDTIGLFRQLTDADKEAVKDWMEITGVLSLQHKKLLELSLGQQRLVLLARALVKDPPLLILDEPCQGLDTAKQAQVLELINAVCVHGNKTMVFVTHYADDRPACINKFIRLEGGTVCEIFQ